MYDLLLTFGIGILAAFLSGMAGGGGGLITTPFFILLGIPPNMAVATTKFGGLGITMGSLAKFRKTKHVRWDYVVYLSLLSIAAAIVGTRILLSSSNEVVEKFIGVMMLVAVPFLLMKGMGVESKATSSAKQVIGYVAYFINLVLQSAFGTGIGMTVPLILMGFFGLTALEAMATRRIPGFILSLVSLLTYMASGIVNYGHGIAVFLGMLVGGYVGSHVAIKKGNSFVKWVMAAMVTILGIQLLL
ncbi:MAG: sulfite exporter TauE/SafE family protein [Patescibacteria group bacterium]